MSADISYLDEARYAAEGFVPAAAHAGLVRMRELCALEPSRRHLGEALGLAALAGRIIASFEAAEEAETGGDEDSASLEWTRALVLMNRFAERSMSPAMGSFACYQKSGRAG
jgi:hypothetical protein